ncbi:hypothetical protein T439DRAFT_331933 [Meredithblackwellia eburnea MCA 4105]
MTITDTSSSSHPSIPSPDPTGDITDCPPSPDLGTETLDAALDSMAIDEGPPCDQVDAPQRVAPDARPSSHPLAPPVRPTAASQTAPLLLVLLRQTEMYTTNVYSPHCQAPRGSRPSR